MRKNVIKKLRGLNYSRIFATEEHHRHVVPCVRSNMPGTTTCGVEMKGMALCDSMNYLSLLDRKRIREGRSPTRT